MTKDQEEKLSKIILIIITLTGSLILIVSYLKRVLCG